MAKRKAKTGARKAARTPRRKVTRKATKAARPTPRAARKAAASSRKATKSRKAAPKRAGTSKPARKASAKRRTPAPPKRQGREGGPVAPKRLGREGGRPKPVALSRERRQLRDDETVPGAPSSLNFAAKASAAESGQQMYHQRAKEHTEGGHALTGGDLDADWNAAYSSGEETPGGDMSTPDQDVVEEIGRALGVEYEDAEELKGADKIEKRDRNRWEYDPASAEDYKDRNRRED
jgi:Family of unknown function (DUF6335)